MAQQVASSNTVAKVRLLRLRQRLSFPPPCDHLVPHSPAVVKHMCSNTLVLDTAKDFWSACGKRAGSGAPLTEGAQSGLRRHTSRRTVTSMGRRGDW